MEVERIKTSNKQGNAQKTWYLNLRNDLESFSSKKTVSDNHTSLQITAETFGEQLIPLAFRAI